MEIDEKYVDSVKEFIACEEHHLEHAPCRHCRAMQGTGY